MNDDGVVRAWLGWRAGQLAQDEAGWNRFVRDLRNTFVPATWAVMARYGLRAYVPTVLRKDKPSRIPDEVALLLYESIPAYQGHTLAVAGRGYSLMHGAIFDFTPGPRRSRSDWVPAPAGVQPKVEAFRRVRSGAGMAFDSADAVVIAIVLDGPAGQPAGEARVMEALGHAGCEAVAVCEPGLTVAWLAAPAGTEAAPIAAALRAALGLPQDAVMAAHAATGARLPFTDPGQPCPLDQLPDLAQDQSLHFRRETPPSAD